MRAHRHTKGKSECHRPCADHLRVGFGNFFGGSLIKITGSELPSIALTATSNNFKTELPFATKLGWFGEVFLSYSFLAYAAIIIALVAAYFFSRTKSGLQLRAVGENPATADAAGINVSKYKYLSTCIGSVIAGLGGLYYVMDYACGVWSNDGFGDRGWLAIALVIFAVWRPNIGILGSILFGGLFIIHNYIPNLAFETQELLKMTPYVVTIVVLVVISMRQKRENQPLQASVSHISERTDNLFGAVRHRPGCAFSFVIFPCRLS